MGLIRIPPKARLVDAHVERRSAAEVLGVADAGASPSGASYWKRLRRCPREHALVTVARLRKAAPPSEALTLGWTFHHALEAYYRARMQSPEVAPALLESAAWDAIRALAHEPGYEELYPIVERVLGAYFEAYRHADDAWRVLAVEETLAYQDEGLRYSARLDLVVHDTASDRTWIVEHKTSRAITADLLTGYQLDMQIVGQSWLWNACVDASAYPPLAGVLVNIVTKAARPKVERVQVYPSAAHRAAFEDSMRQWAALEGAFRDLGWPRALGNCTGPTRYFGTCDFFDVCHGRPDADVATLADEAPPYGFDRGPTASGTNDDNDNE